ncbi:MAG: Unknown protein [uncultured Sulfurovum sp.]|uniref:Uncharacterized protein n=1 Tax=uncultured Sulfurovum sp. TaxID=269237 RepID=A0A6S6TME4_9BACT|nr:MAG: Unknown protein [uncultured Sulfurovum sp.]
MEYDDNKYKYLIMKWFRNARNNIKNKEILILDKRCKRILNEVKHVCREVENLSILCEKPLRDRYKGNIIFLRSNMTHDLSMFNNRSFLYVENNHKFFENMSEYIWEDEEPNYSNEFLVKEERYLYFFEKVDPLSLIEKSNVELESYIKKTKTIYTYFESYEKIEANTKYENMAEDNFESILKMDIANIVNCKILPSRLAVLVYRLSTLNINATKTEAGRYFHKKLGTKSKNYNYHSLQKTNKLQLPHLSSGSLQEFMLKYFKAYDLQSNETETKIRKEIARELKRLKKLKLNISDIAKVTKLPIKVIEKMY